MVEFLKETTTTLQNTKSFVAEQAPDVIRQLLNYELVSSIIVFVGSLGLILTAFFIYNHYRKLVKKENSRRARGLADIYLAILVIVLIFGCVPALCSFSNIIKITVAPKVYVLEYLKK